MIKYIYYSMISIVALVFVGSIYFLYHNFYLTLAGAQDVESLVVRVSSVGFDPRKVETVVQKIKEKESATSTPIAIDPFYR